MNIQQGGAEERSEYFAAAWRDLKRRRGIAAVVLIAAMSSALWVLRGTTLPLFGLTWVLSASAVWLSDRFVKAFCCPRCAHKYFHSNHPLLDFRSYQSKACTHCNLPLWASDKTPGQRKPLRRRFRSSR